MPTPTPTPTRRQVLATLVLTLGSLAGCATVLERAQPKQPLAEFGSLPEGTPHGYVEFFHTPRSDFPGTMAAWQGYAGAGVSQPRPDGSYAAFRNKRDPLTNEITPWRVRLLVPVGPQRFTLLILGTSNSHDVTVPVEAGQVTPVQVEWKIVASSILGSKRYVHDIQVGQPVPHVPLFPLAPLAQRP